MSHAGDTVVVGADGDEALALRVDPHGAELIESEGLAVLADALLDEESGALAAQLDQQPQDQEQG